MDQVEPSPQALVKKNERAGDVAPQGLLAMFLAPVNIRPSRLPGAVDHHVGRNAIQFGRDPPAIRDVDFGTGSPVELLKELLAKKTLGTKDQFFHRCLSTK